MIKVTILKPKRRIERKDGGDALIEYEVIQGPAPLNRNYPEETYIPANGIFKGTILDKNERAKRRKQRQDRKDKKLSIREQRVAGKAAAAKTTAQAQIEAAKAMGKDDGSNALLASALASSSKPATKKTHGLSTGAKVGIAVGVAAVVGIGIFLFIKYKKKHKK